MKHFTRDDSYILVLEKGELLHECLRDFMLDMGIVTAWVQGIGAAIELEVGYYDLELQTYRWKQFNGPYEITSLHGNVVRDTDAMPQLHLHGTFSDTECNAVGGHVNKLVVGGTCELLIKDLKIPVTRSKDDATGLNLLCAIPNTELA